MVCINGSCMVARRCCNNVSIIIYDILCEIHIKRVNEENPKTEREKMNRNSRFFFASPVKCRRRHIFHIFTFLINKNLNRAVTETS